MVNWEQVARDMWTYLIQELSAYCKGDGPVSTDECNYGQAVTQDHLERLVLLVQKHTTKAREEGE